MLKNPNQNLFEILNLSGRKAFWSQGYYGQNVLVANIDTGILVGHQEFEDRVLDGKSFVGSNMKPGYHGTLTASLSVGQTVGVAPKAKLLPLEITDNDNPAYLHNIADAIIYAVDHGADIINLSYSSSSNYGHIHDAIKYAEKHNVLVVCTLGNTGKYEIRYPAAFKETMAVGSVDLEKKICSFSSYGTSIDVCQIGNNVVGASYKRIDEYTIASGQSVSAPIVTGIGALLICKHKALNNYERMPIDLLRYALKILFTKDIGKLGFDDYYGYGFCTLQPLVSDKEFVIDQRQIKINGKEIEMETEAKIENGRTMVPLRYVNDGGCVLWIPEERKVKIMS